MRLFGAGSVSKYPPSNEFRIRTRSLRNVSELVELLVSPVPAKHPEGEFDLRGDDSIGSLLHPQVEAAYNRLVKMGTAIYPQLVKHLRDDRYSYSRVETAWNNYSIGDAMVEIMAEGVEVEIYRYKWRKNKTDGNGWLGFEAMGEEIGWEKYANYASTRSKPRLQKEFVQWKLNKEQEFGFANAEQEKALTTPYLKWLAEH